MVLGRIIYSLLGLCICLSANGQSNLFLEAGDRIVITVTASDGLWRMPAFQPDEGPHRSVFIKWASRTTLPLEVNTTTDTIWRGIEIDEHLSDQNTLFSKLQYVKAGQELQVRYRNNESFQIHVYQPGHSALHAIRPKLEGRSVDCACPQPSMLDRLAWCSSCPGDPTPVENEPGHFIVHHSAGGNQSNDWPAVVRSIWDFHVNGRGWDDVGYNYLIDPEGRIYEGRGENLLGAHFCGTNRATLGVCLLGNYVAAIPSDTMRQSLKDIASWQLCQWGKNPNEISRHASSGKDLFHISGHRDGCSTACPGDNVYQNLPQIRMNTLDQMLTCEGDTTVRAPMRLMGRLVGDFEATLRGEEVPFAEAVITLEEEQQLAFDTTGREWKISERAFPFIVDLFPNRMHVFRLRADYPDGRKLYSNYLRFSTPALAQEEERIYPNPATQQVRISLVNDYMGEVRIRCYDVMGRLCLQTVQNKEVVDQEILLDVNGLLPGVYFISIQQEEQKLMQFVKLGQ